MAYVWLTMQLLRQSLFYLEWDAEGMLHSPLPLEVYSKYKYGCAESARKLGYSLALMAIRNNNGVLESPELFLSASAYREVPTAAQQLAQYFGEIIDIWRKERGLAPLLSLKLERETLFEGDYGMLQTAEREELMSKNTIAVPTELAGKNMVVIDDVRITGSHEQKVAEVLQTAGAAVVLKLYVGEKYSEHTPAQVEHLLNHGWVDRLSRFVAIVNSPNWQVNARVCKYLLSYPKREDLEVACKALLPDRLENILWAISADGYDTMPMYCESAAYLKALAAQVHHEYAEVGLPNA